MVAPIGFTRDDQFMDYPDVAADTRRFTAGAPRAVTVSTDGTRVVFLRSTGPTDPVEQLWVHDVPTGTERLIFEPTSPSGTHIPPMRYATDARGLVAGLVWNGRLVTADLADGRVTAHDDTTAVHDPRPDPDGRRLGYVSEGTLRVRDLRTGHDTLLAGELGDP